MANRIEAARFMHETAEQLRRIANYSSFLAPQLLRLAQDLDDHAHTLESAAGDLDTGQAC
jgi:hypothetical protein